MRWLIWTSATLAVLLLVLGSVYLTGTAFGWRPGMPNPCFPTAANPY